MEINVGYSACPLTLSLSNGELRLMRMEPFPALHLFHQHWHTEMGCMGVSHALVPCRGRAQGALKEIRGFLQKHFVAVTNF